MNSDAISNEKILVVDENHGIYQLIAPNLAAESFTVSYMASAAEAANADLTKYSLLIIDAMTQEFNGLMLVRKIKANPNTTYIPLMLCTELDSQDDIVRGFDAGVDDYVVKPFSIRELVARAKALIRRAHRVMPARPDAASSTIADTPAAAISFCGLTIDPSRRAVIAPDGHHIMVTQTEFAILAMLLANLNHYFSREQIRLTVWSHRPEEVNDRTIDVNISRLRKKLGTIARHLVNKSGRGYAMIENV